MELNTAQRTQNTKAFSDTYPQNGRIIRPQLRNKRQLQESSNQLYPCPVKYRLGLHNSFQLGVTVITIPKIKFTTQTLSFISSYSLKGNGHISEAIHWYLLPS